ncbi:hypothetical protein [Bacillus sp. FJAT-50079]|uniref:hypothetical protein n=1 Tax=Bacillus sp. FJAT-50079 TaxID=2833577 RepID=UPI001BCA5CFB|nr:hypothetical protein [Bacillus sp. FJAT-50079]MBS4210438.1 hypothetical protein [Bacillus sp. FJAT-50079]
MKRLFLILVISSILSACDLGNNEISFSEVNLVEVNGDVKEFINHIQTFEEGTGNGIYIFNDSEKRRYLYLSQEFLDNESGFGNMDIKTEENSFNIYLNNNSNSKEEINGYKLYEINLDKVYEYIKVFKYGEETYFQTVGL